MPTGPPPPEYVKGHTSTKVTAVPTIELPTVTLTAVPTITLPTVTLTALPTIPLPTLTVLPTVTVIPTLDVDGDGYVDIVQCGYFSKNIVWLKNPGKSGGPWVQTEIDSP